MSEHIIEIPDYTSPFDPAARAVSLGEEIVRCRDCKHARVMHPLDWRTGKPSTVVEEWYCSWHSNAEGASDIEPNGFCAWGERRNA